MSEKLTVLNLDNTIYVGCRCRIKNALGQTIKHVLSATLETGEILRIKTDKSGQFVFTDDRTDVVREFVRHPAPLRAYFDSPRQLEVHRRIRSGEWECAAARSV